MTHTMHDENGSENKTRYNTTCAVHCSSDERCGGVFMGGAFILAGTALLLDRLGYLPLEVGSVWSLWPVLMVWGGVVNFLLLGRGGSPGWGLGLTAAGGLLLADNLGYVDLRWALIWPALFIAAGVAIVWGTFFHKKKGHGKEKGEIAAGRFETNIVMGAREDTVTSREFEGGSISCVMGGLDLDLRGAEIRGEEAVLDVKVVMGGVELAVPPHWEIVSRCSPVLGEIENKARRPGMPVEDGRPVKRLVIAGSIVMGGMEIHY